MKSNIDRVFYVTFGQRYQHEPHPFLGHPDGWFEIIAPDEEAARLLITSACGERWSFMYDSAFNRSHYPLGCLCTLIGGYFIMRGAGGMFFVADLGTELAPVRASFLHVEDCIEWAKANPRQSAPQP